MYIIQNHAIIIRGKKVQPLRSEYNFTKSLELLYYHLGLREKKKQVKYNAIYNISLKLRVIVRNMWEKLKKPAENISIEAFHRNERVLKIPPCTYT